jgi:UDP-N-acetyl-2-amino-2-deoxyglucuronate dehydrogenase
MTATLRVAVAGIGNAGLEHLRAFGEHPGAQVRSIVNPDAGAAAAVRGELGLDCAIHESLDAALRDDELDAVVIATPNALHPAMAEAVARAGKHILLEKPAALDAASLDRMLAAVRAAGVICQVNMILRWHPMIESIVRLREEGVLGEIHTVEADFVFGELEGSEPDWARTVADGGSLHLYAGCHAYDQLEWLMQDQAVEVASVSGRRSPKWEYDVTACTILRFARGGIGRATVTLEAASPYHFGTRVFGTGATVIDNTVCVPGQHDDAFVEHCKERVDVTYLPFDRVAADFIENVASGRDSHAALEHTAGLFRLAMDADRAARDHTVERRQV